MGGAQVREPEPSTRSKPKEQQTEDPPSYRDNFLVFLPGLSSILNQSGTLGALPIRTFEGGTAYAQDHKAHSPLISSLLEGWSGGMDEAVSKTLTDLGSRPIDAHVML